MRKTIEQILELKRQKKKITVLTAYDYSLAMLLDRAGIDIILVGDSVANVVLGLPSTTEIGMEEMLHHAKAVNRAVKKACVVGDMPYNSYQLKPEAALSNARRLMEEAGCDAVKIEWFDQCLDVAGNIIKAGIPVMGHVGLTPQTADKLGGFKVQGKESEAASRIIDQAHQLEKIGCFSLVLECIPSEVTEIISRKLLIPTIGIGAGPHCDGQVLVTHDMLGLFDRFTPKFAKQWVNLGDEIVKAVEQYHDDVINGHFPDDQHSFHMNKEELRKLLARE